MAVGLALVIIWEVLLKYVANSWGILAINIGFFLLTIHMIAWWCFWFFKSRVGSAKAFLIGAGIWALMAILIRSAISYLVLS